MRRATRRRMSAAARKILPIVAAPIVPTPFDAAADRIAESAELSAASVAYRTGDPS